MIGFGELHNAIIDAQKLQKELSGLRRAIQSCVTGLREAQDQETVKRSNLIGKIETALERMAEITGE